MSEPTAEEAASSAQAQAPRAASSSAPSSAQAAQTEPRRPGLDLKAIPREAANFIEIVAYAIGWLGVIIIVYGLVSTMTSEVWVPLERFILPIAASLVLLTTLLNALTIYFAPQASGPPAAASRYITGPVVILLCIAGFVCVWLQDLPVAVILGIAILGLTFSLLRLLPQRAVSW